jgi:hypothetical protein
MVFLNNAIHHLECANKLAVPELADAGHRNNREGEKEPGNKGGQEGRADDEDAED